MKNLYIKSIYVFYNYVKRNILIDLIPSDNNLFKHLILTGKNGAGKSTILKSIFKELMWVKAGIMPSQIFFTHYKISNDKKVVDINMNSIGYLTPKVELDFTEVIKGEDDLLLISIPAFRQYKVNDADSNKTLVLNTVYKSYFDHIKKIKNQSLSILSIRNTINELST